MIRSANLDLSLTLMIGDSLVLLFFALILSGILSLFLLKKWGFPKVFFCSFLVAIFLGATGLIWKFNEDQGMKEADSAKLDTYKKIVIKTSTDKIKKVGHVKTEFLNDDNLYENYVYNYAIKFPEDFKLNYGVGKHSQVMAYDKVGGHQILINAGDLNIDYSLSHKESNAIIESADEKARMKFAEELINKWEEEGSYQDIVLKNSFIVNYYNKKFIRFDFTANRNLNDNIYSLTISDFLTFYKSYNYHFQFEGNNINNDIEDSIWQETILSTMASLRITESINQDD